MEVEEEGVLGGSGSSSYAYSGISATNIWFVRSESDIVNSEKVYKPALCHQVYNPNETIFGYHYVCVNVYYNGKTMDCYVDIEASGQIKENIDLGIRADNIMGMLRPWLPDGFCTDKETFIQRLKTEECKIFGTPKAAFQIEIPKRGIFEFTVTQIANDEPGFKELHDRFQRVIVWYIDAANIIDLNDPRWTCFYVYETVEGNVFPVGFCTVYLFYKYPNKTRTRISQFFIIPSHQRMGLGTKLLEIIYKTFQEQEDVFDITVEDPSKDFRGMRDVLDCKLLKELPEFSDSFVLQQPFCKIAATSAEMSYKIYSEQARRVYEILNLYYAGKDPKLLQEWCRRVKRRLKVPIEKDSQTVRKKKLATNYLSYLTESEPPDPEAINKRFKQFLEEILPIVHKLQNLYGRDVVKLASDVKRIWEKI